MFGIFWRLVISPCQHKSHVFLEFAQRMHEIKASLLKIIQLFSKCALLHAPIHIV